MNLKTSLKLARVAARLCVTLMLAHTTNDAAGQTPAGATPPPTRTESIKETLHGVEVEDPYRWLEEDEGAEVRAWTDAQNARARGALDAVRGRAALRAEMERALRTGALDAPEPRGKRLFYTRRDPRHARHDGRVRHARRAAARAKVRRATPGRERLRPPRPPAHRDEGRARRGQARREADRRGDRRLGVFVLAVGGEDLILDGTDIAVSVSVCGQAGQYHPR